MKLKLEIDEPRSEREEWQLESEEAQKAHEAGEAEAQKAQDLSLAELREAELELKAEQEKALLETELEAKKEAVAHEHEVKWLVWIDIPLQTELVPLTLLEILD